MVSLVRKGERERGGGRKRMSDQSFFVQYHYNNDMNGINNKIGMDSMTAVQLRQTLEEATGIGNQFFNSLVILFRIEFINFENDMDPYRAACTGVVSIW